jgi:CBS domain-containing protein
MKIKDVMSASPCFILGTATIQEAAQKMKQLDCGFLPVGENDKLIGTITDRDIATRATAEGLPVTTKVSEVMTKKVLYCAQEDTTDSIAQNMIINQIRRLVVLDNRTSKRLVGVIALADIVTSNNTKANTAHELIKGVSQPSPSNSNRKNKKAA